MQQAEAALANAKNDQAATEITAPVAGEVRFTHFAVGNELKAGDTVLNITDADSLWLEVRLADDKAALVSPGQYAAYEIDGRQYSGTVLSVEKPLSIGAVATEGAPTDTEDNRTVIKISLPEDGAFAAGTKVRVTIAVGGA